MSEIIEKIMITEKKINPNLDFYSSTVFRYLGIDTDLYPVIFAISRIVGWCTHIMEQYSNNRLIRPLSQYTGPQGLKYEPLARRTSAATAH
jgi:citrate synthase